jgi:hypothetical protein
MGARESLFQTRYQRLALLRAKTKPFGSVRPAEQPPICGVTVSSSWHEPVACAYPPDHEGVHSWGSIPALPPGKSRMTKKEAGIRLAIIAAEIRLTLDERDQDCPSWADDLDRIAGWLHPGGSV